MFVAGVSVNIPPYAHSGETAKDILKINIFKTSAPSNTYARNAAKLNRFIFYFAGNGNLNAGKSFNTGIFIVFI